MTAPASLTALPLARAHLPLPTLTATPHSTVLAGAPVLASAQAVDAARPHDKRYHLQGAFGPPLRRRSVPHYAGGPVMWPPSGDA